MADFASFNNHNDTYVGNMIRKELPRLPSGAYKLELNQQTGDLYFKKFDTHYDKLIDLPSPEFEEVMLQVNQFLNPDTCKIFDEYGFLYKRSFLLHGPPGTGKTCIVNRVGEKVTKAGGIILFNPNPKLLEMAFKILDDTQPDVTTMVILEEFEVLLASYEEELLSILDGEIQKNNVMYLATTNHYDRIPLRLKRPGRFPAILEVKFPNTDARTVYLSQKLKAKDSNLIPMWVEKSDGLSIDELKESVLAVMCMNRGLDEVIERIKSTKADAQAAEGDYDGEDDEIYVDPMILLQNSMFGRGQKQVNKKARR